VFFWCRQAIPTLIRKKKISLPGTILIWCGKDFFASPKKKGKGGKKEKRGAGGNLSPQNPNTQFTLIDFVGKGRGEESNGARRKRTAHASSMTSTNFYERGEGSLASGRNWIQRQRFFPSF